MASPRELTGQLDSVVREAEEALAGNTAREYEQFRMQLATLRDMARELAQRQLEGRYRGIVSKLEDGEALTDSERELVRMLICGEADYYVNTEEDVPRWKDDLRSTVESLSSLRGEGVDELEDLMKLQAFCEDAMKVLPDLTNFLRDRERVDRFDRNLEDGLSPESGRILADVIRDRMSSKYR